MNKLRNLVRRIGHRGAFLLFLALLDFLYGYALFATAQPPLHKVLSYMTWGVIWTLVGVVTFAGSFMKRDRVPFGCAATLKAAWACQWILVWLYDPQVPMPWTNVALWSAFSGLIVIVSTWPEVRRIRRKNGEGRELWIARPLSQFYWQCLRSRLVLQPS